MPLAMRDMRLPLHRILGRAHVAEKKMLTCPGRPLDCGTRCCGWFQVGSAVVNAWKRPRSRCSRGLVAKAGPDRAGFAGEIYWKG